MQGASGARVTQHAHAFVSRDILGHLDPALRAEARFGLLFGRHRPAVVVAGRAGTTAKFAPHRLVDFLTLVRQDGFVTLQTTMWSGEIRRPHLRDLCGRTPSAPAGGRSSLLHMAI